MTNVDNLARSAYYGVGNDIGYITVEDAEITLANWRDEGMEGIDGVSPADYAKAWNTIVESETKKEVNPMTNEAIWRILELTDYLNRNNIFLIDDSTGIKCEKRFEFGRAVDLCKCFEREAAANEVTIPISLHIEGDRYDGTLTVRRDGTHACKMTHDNDEWKE